MATKRYRLTARAQMDGMVRDPGYEFSLEDGQKGPMRTERIAGGKDADVPLYVEVVDGKPVEVEHGASAADGQAAGGPVIHPKTPTAADQESPRDATGGPVIQPREGLRPQGEFEKPTVEHGASVADLPPKAPINPTG